MRLLSEVLREALFADNSTEVPIFLLTITHPELDAPVYLSTDPTERVVTTKVYYRTQSRGTDFLYAAIEVTIPDEKDRAPPTSQLTIPNVDRELIPLARSVNSPASVKIEVVLASALDDVEMVWPQMDMTNLQYDVGQLIFDLTIDALMTEPYPSGRFLPAYFSALFA